MNLGEIQKPVDTTPRELTEDTVMGLSASKSVPDNEKEVEAVPENKLSEEFWLFMTVLTSFMTWTFYDMGTETKANGGRRTGTI